MKGAHFDTLLPTLGNIVAYHLKFAHIFLLLLVLGTGSYE
jgi:hypothetical protein